MSKILLELWTHLDNFDMLVNYDRTWQNFEPEFENKYLHSTYIPSQE